ncbi:HprK-related kinase A [Glaciecola petra]|uniref:HprK-related kinase A n=1 Tax=Glaciecola petra TaxID=3075602 RepID=A0ABU2ZLW9_9ALTE|nr:HprK-related kinase A [Aestuariibacter sp. P117]MDT0593625.1 HprK-related kinase A [Aestuariibacter sp. P117]
MLIDCGLYTYRFSGVIGALKPELSLLYPNSFIEESTNHKHIPTFDIHIEYTSALRRFIRRQLVLNVEGQQPFHPIPPHKLLPSIEWSMNWCAASYDHTRLLIHCSVVVKNGKAILFPAKSGSGKSTTATFLSLNGWSLYSDEMAIIDLESAKVLPVFRPSSLKNQSIDIIKPLVKEQQMSHVTKGTHKGDIAHVRTQTRIEYDQLMPAEIVGIVFLDFGLGQSLRTYEIEKSVAFAKLIANAFNYSVLGESAFKALAKIVNESIAIESSYSNMNDIALLLEELIV